MNSSKISAVLIVKNAQDTIRECLESIKGFDEIVILENGSSDNTLAVIEEFDREGKKVKLYKSEFIGFGPLKNLAVSYAKNEWVFCIDADEVLEKEAFLSIENLDLDKNTIYQIQRANLYNGEWIKACGWHKDFVKRLFNKKTTQYNDNQVHEGVIIKESMVVGTINGYLKHYAFKDATHLLAKLQSYSSLWAKQNLHKKSSPAKAILRSSFAFIKSYILKNGFLYGYRGFLISVCNANGVFFKYIKLYELNKKLPSSSLIVTTYNNKDALELVLESIKNQKIMPTEVLIADDGSDSNTEALVKKYQRDFVVPLKHIWHEDKGFRLSHIRNLAIKEAVGEYLIVIDGDMVLDEYFVFDHIKNARKKCFLQGSRIILDPKKTDKITKTKEIQSLKKVKNIKNFRSEILSKIILRNKIDKNIFQKQTLISGVRGCNMSFFKQDAMDINGFNEDFNSWGREDSEFIARFLFGGGVFAKIKYNALAYHLHHEESSKKMLEQNHQIYLDALKNKTTLCKNGINKI